MGCICPKPSTAGDDYVQFGNYIGERNFFRQKSGRGQNYYDNGDMYDGMWRRNKKHGYGVYTYKDGKRLEGFFKDDKFLGEIFQGGSDNEDQDEPLARNAGSRDEKQEGLLSEEKIAKKEAREQRKKEHDERLEEMKKKYGL